MNDQYLWLENFIGKPFCYGANGPEAFDCWGLVQALYRELFRYEIKTLNTYPQQKYLYPRAIYKETLSADWLSVQKPHFGNLALFSRKKTTYDSPKLNAFPEHIGMVVPYGKQVHILHAIEPSGVVCEPLNRITLRGLHLYNYYKRSLSK